MVWYQGQIQGPGPGHPRGIVIVAVGFTGPQACRNIARWLRGVTGVSCALSALVVRPGGPGRAAPRGLVGLRGGCWLRSGTLPCWRAPLLQGTVEYGAGRVDGRRRRLQVSHDIVIHERSWGDEAVEGGSSETSVIGAQGRFLEQSFRQPASECEGWPGGPGVEREQDARKR